MTAVRNRFRTLHTVLMRDAFYSVSLASLLALGLLFLRGHLSHTWLYNFLIWNLALAWAPYLMTLGMALRYENRRASIGQLLLPGLIWLLAFPNAPYLLTEFIQLRLITPDAWIWYDLGLLGAFAFTGCYLSVASLHTMRTLVKAACGRWASWTFTIVASLLTGFGVSLGRFQRWNSWDVVVNPQGLISDLSSRLADPLSHPQTFGFTIIFAALLFVCYVTFTRGRQTQRTVSA